MSNNGRRVATMYKMPAPQVMMIAGMAMIKLISQRNMHKPREKEARSAY
jgi:hypothetical protein